MEFERCRDILLEETGLVHRIQELQNLIREAVINRDWTDFEGHFSALGEIQGEFTLLESEREQIFAGLQAGEGELNSFYALVSQIPADKRNELTEIFRNLKLETLRVQITGEAIMGFISGARATMAGFFEIAFPDRKGKIYTPHGKPVSHDMRSMVLNRSF